MLYAGFGWIVAAAFCIAAVETKEPRSRLQRHKQTQLFFKQSPRIRAPTTNEKQEGRKKDEQGDRASLAAKTLAKRRGRGCTSLSSSPAFASRRPSCPAPAPPPPPGCWSALTTAQVKRKARFPALFVSADLSPLFLYFTVWSRGSTLLHYWRNDNDWVVIEMLLN